METRQFGYKKVENRQLDIKKCPFKIEQAVTAAKWWLQAILNNTPQVVVSKGKIKSKIRKISQQSCNLPRKIWLKK